MLRELKVLSVVVISGCLLSQRATAGEIVYGVTDNQSLVSWNSTAPGALLSGSAITGLQPNEQVLAIDYRPATGELYALGSTSRLYTLNTATGGVTEVGTGPFSPPINGSNFGFDFNPTIDRIRLDSDVNKNYVLNPNDGTATEVTDLFFGPGDQFEGDDPNVVHASYTNSFAGATTTQLFGIDTGKDILVTQANSAGTLGTVGSIGTDVTAVGGFDISGATGLAYLAIQDVGGASSTFWTVDLATGVGSVVGEVGGGNIITAVSVAPVPEPATSLLLVTSLGLLITKRRR